MARLTRKTLSLFAGSAADNGQFGSAQASAPLVSSDPTVLQQLTAWTNGWFDAVIGGRRVPPLEEFQGVQYVHSYMAAYLMQEGIAEYDAGTTYYQHSKAMQPGTYKMYGSITDANIGNPLTDVVHWQFLQDLSAQAVSGYYGVTTNAGNVYSVTTSPSVGALVAGQAYEIKFNAANTGAITLNVDAIGAVSVLDKDGNALSSGAIVAARRYFLFFDGAEFIILGELGVAPSIKSVKTQTITGSGTYTPSPFMVYAEVEAVGAGGGGGGANGATAVGGGGGAGGYDRTVLTAATIGASQACIIGASGSGGSAAGGSGGTGGNTTFGAILTASGGGGGAGSTATVGNASAGGAGGTASGGDLNIAGQTGSYGTDDNDVTNRRIAQGDGASGIYGAGGRGIQQCTNGSTTPAAGASATGFGAGGAGANGTAESGGSGSSGVIYVTEYCSQ